MKRNRENGEVVVEVSIVVTFVVVFIAVMFYIGMILYQQSLVSVMANQTASNIAQVYSNNIRDPFTGYIDPESVYQSITYSNMKTDAYIDVINQKANAFAKYRLRSSRILAAGSSDVSVELVKKSNELLKSQVVVTVNDSYQLPLVSFFGTSDLLNFTATGRADCVDLMEYMNGVAAIGDPETSSVGFLPDMDNCRITFIADRENPSVYATVTVLNGKSILSSNRYTHSVMPANPVKGSYIFKGWRNEAGGTFTASTEVSSDIVVYGNWACKVTFDSEGGRIFPSVKDAGYFVYTIDVEEGLTATFPGGSGYPLVFKSGYNFKGWYTGRNGTGTQYISNDTRIESDVTLYAFWECTHEGSNGYTFVSRHGYLCVDHPYDLYRCGRCGAEKQVAVEGQHNTDGRCNVKHPAPDPFHCTAINGYHASGGMYHVTCTGCGRVATSTGTIEFDGRVHEYWYWCGIHVASSVPVTPTH